MAPQGQRWNRRRPVETGMTSVEVPRLEQAQPIKASVDTVERGLPRSCERASTGKARTGKRSGQPVGSQPPVPQVAMNVCSQVGSPGHRQLGSGRWASPIKAQTSPRVRTEPPAARAPPWTTHRYGVSATPSASRSRTTTLAGSTTWVARTVNCGARPPIVTRFAGISVAASISPTIASHAAQSSPRNRRPPASMPAPTSDAISGRGPPSRSADAGQPWRCARSRGPRNRYAIPSAATPTQSRRARARSSSTLLE